MDKCQIGFRIKEARQKRGYTRNVLGYVMDISPKQISQYESGTLDFSEASLQLLARALNVDVGIFKSQTTPSSYQLPVHNLQPQCRLTFE